MQGTGRSVSIGVARRAGCRRSNQVAAERVHRNRVFEDTNIDVHEKERGSKCCAICITATMWYLSIQQNKYTAGRWVCINTRPWAVQNPFANQTNPRRSLVIVGVLTEATREPRAHGGKTTATMTRCSSTHATTPVDDTWPHSTPLIPVSADMSMVT